MDQKKRKGKRSGPRGKLRVLRGAQKASEKASKDSAKEPPAPQATEGSAGVKPGTDRVRCAPDALRCQRMIGKDGEESRRCTRYTVKRPEGGRGAYCVVHDDTAASRKKMEEARSKGGNTEAANHVNPYADLERTIGQHDYLTQDDIAAERRRILFQLATKKIPAAAGNALLNGLAQASAHIEQFGGKQGVEGGSGYLRLLPGVKLIEQLDDKNRPLTSEEFKLLYERQEADVKRGRKPPTEWKACILLYLGLERDPEVAYDEKQEPIGEYRYELVDDLAHPGEKTVKRSFVRYTARDLTKKRLEDEARIAARARGQV